MSPDDTISVLRALDSRSRTLAMRFPPLARVRALTPLHIPGPGTTGIVVGYGHDHTIIVATEDFAIHGECEPDNLVVIETHDVMTSEWVSSVLDR